MYYLSQFKFNLNPSIVEQRIKAKGLAQVLIAKQTSVSGFLEIRINNAHQVLRIHEY